MESPIMSRSNAWAFAAATFSACRASIPPCGTGAIAELGASSARARADRQMAAAVRRSRVIGMGRKRGGEPTGDLFFAGSQLSEATSLAPQVNGVRDQT